MKAFISLTLLLSTLATPKAQAQTLAQEAEEAAEIGELASRNLSNPSAGKIAPKAEVTEEDPLPSAPEENASSTPEVEAQDVSDSAGETVPASDSLPSTPAPGRASPAAASAPTQAKQAPVAPKREPSNLGTSAAPVPAARPSAPVAPPQAQGPSPVAAPQLAAPQAPAKTINPAAVPATKPQAPMPQADRAPAQTIPSAAPQTRAAGGNRVPDRKIKGSDVGLTPAQSQQILAIRQASKLDLEKKLTEELKNAKADMNRAMVDATSSLEIRKKFELVQRKTLELQAIKFERTLKIREVLTVEQRKKLNELKTSH